MEWTVVTVLIAIVGFMVTMGTPIIRLNQTITRLNVTLQHLQNDAEAQKKAIAAQQQAAHESHKRLWEHNTKQDEQLSDHERRIGLLEHDKE